MNIGTLLSRHARSRSDHLAVVFEDHRLTFRQFNARVNRLEPSQIIALLNHPGVLAEEAGVDRDDHVGGGAVASRVQEPPERGVAQAVLRALRPHRGIHDGLRPQRCGPQGGVGYEMRILDETGREVPPGQVGEICGRRPLMIAGYYKHPDQIAKAIVDGWLHSGDLRYVDEDGYLFLVDRKKDMIISGGVNVYLRDIEEVAAQDPAVQEVAVFAPELMEWINARVGAKFQRVSAVMIMEDFPRNIAGKALKRVLQERYYEKG